VASLVFDVAAGHERAEYGRDPAKVAAAWIEGALETPVYGLTHDRVRAVTRQAKVIFGSSDEPKSYMRIVAQPK
jgi:hypothetical protein